MDPAPDSRTPEGRYRARHAAAQERREREARRSRLLSRLRLAAFAAVVGFGVWAEEKPGPLPLALTGAALIGFVALVARHQTVRQREEWFADLAEVSRQGLHRLARRWDAIPVRAAPPDAVAHPYAADLDLYGPASLSQLLGPQGSARGQAVLYGWLLAPAPPDTVAPRQAAVRELAPALDLRDALAVHGHRTRSVAEADLRGFVAWAESPAWLSGQAWVRWMARVLPPLIVASLLLEVLVPAAPPLWLLLLAAALALTLGPGRRAHREFDRAFAREGMFRHYPELLEAAASHEARTPLMVMIGQKLDAGAEPAHRRMARLRRLMQLADLRYSAMLHLPVQLLTLWDFHVLDALERWKATSGAHVRGWLDALGEVEALAALAALAHDHPDWCFPELSDGPPRLLAAEALGHPLLGEGERVTNDVTVGPPSRFLFVTGSNLSGKSTLLRALGTNVVLAHAGGPVCAGALRLPPLVVRSSVRVQDSLARGVSYFMAELQKLKEVVDEADRLAGDPRWTLFYLLDEILQGTNTAERQVAARRVIRHLVDAGALGAVTSHDLELTAGPELADAAAAVHFSERFEHDADGRARMTFDYRLREGVATSTNALRLMELVGLSAGMPEGTG
ncbi:MAG TPA: hypothetical protein VMK65_05295 [Longimicrobiales bacterium]|nr:hypothetical protein [Longimicrobiales bacterium]